MNEDARDILRRTLYEATSYKLPLPIRKLFGKRAFKGWEARVLKKDYVWFHKGDHKGYDVSINASDGYLQYRLVWPASLGSKFVPATTDWYVDPTNHGTLILKGDADDQELDKVIPALQKFVAYLTKHA